MQELKHTTSPDLVTCPECNCQVSPRRLEDHRLRRCPKHKGNFPRIRRRPEKLITRNRIYAMPQHETTRCRFCGRAAIPGTNTCYSCMG